MAVYHSRVSALPTLRGSMSTMTITEKTVPYNSEMEQAYLGACFINPATLKNVPLEEDDFYLHKHKRIHRAMIAVDEVGNLDLLTVMDQLEKSDDLEAIGGAAYLTGLSAAVPSAVSAPHYAQVVKETARQRRILDVVSEIAIQAYARKPPDQIIDFGKSALDAHSLGSVNVHDANDGAASVVAKAYHYQSNPLLPGQVRGIDTGYEVVNKAIGGWMRSAVYYFLAVRHFGKTWVCLNLAVRAAMAGAHVGIFSLEMSASTDPEEYEKSTLWERIILSQVNVSMKAYRMGQLLPDHMKKLDDVANAVAGLDLWIEDGVTNLSDISATIYKRSRTKPLDIVFVDYLGLIDIPDDRRSRNENQRIGEVCKGLKVLARDANIALFVPHQVSGKAIDSRPYENGGKRPRLDDGYESGYLSQHADVVFGGYRDELYTQISEYPNVMDVTILKNRLSNGSGSYWHWYFSSNGGLFDVSTQKPPPF